MRTTRVCIAMKAAVCAEAGCNRRSSADLYSALSAAQMLHLRQQSPSVGSHESFPAVFDPDGSMSIEPFGHSAQRWICGIFIVRIIRLRSFSCDLFRSGFNSFDNIEITVGFDMKPNCLPMQNLLKYSAMRSVRKALPGSGDARRAMLEY